MINYVMPVLGATGLFVLKPPFNTMMPAEVVYTCESVRTIKDCIANNQDIFTEIYEPAQLGDEVYQEAIHNEIPIVSLRAEDGQWIYVPADYIETYPVVDGVMYRQMMIGVSTPLIDSSVDMEDLKIRVGQLVHDFIGRECQVDLMEISTPIMLSQSAHAAEKAIRDANIQRSPPAEKTIRDQQVLIDSQATHIHDLEQWIGNNS